jgi:hypothetical protein
MDITDASHKLYDSLKQYKEVVGTGVQRGGKMPCIIIYLTEASKIVLEKIPSSYYGNLVKTVVSGQFFS